MSDDHSWVWLALVVATYIAVVFGGCAGYEERPIDRYRALYYFSQ